MCSVVRDLEVARGLLARLGQLLAFQVGPLNARGGSASTMLGIACCIPVVNVDTLFSEPNITACQAHGRVLARHSALRYGVLKNQILAHGTRFQFYD